MMHFVMLQMVKYSVNKIKVQLENTGKTFAACIQWVYNSTKITAKCPLKIQQRTTELIT
jgi:hypothetical protein